MTTEGPSVPKGGTFYTHRGACCIYRGAFYTYRGTSCIYRGAFYRGACCIYGGDPYTYRGASYDHKEASCTYRGASLLLAMGGLLYLRRLPVTNKEASHT